MSQFFKNIALYSIVLIALNVALGAYLRSYESKDLKAKGKFYPALRWEEYYAFKEDLDILVLGSSHAYRGYVPEILEARLGLDGLFNFGSSGQTPKTGYFILEEVLQKHRPKVVIMDVFVMVFTEDISNTNGRINLTAMQRGEGRSKFFQEGFSPAQKLELSLFPSYTYRGYLEFKIKKLLGMNYLGREKGNYEGRGFVSNTDTLSYEALKYINATAVPIEKLDFITDESLMYLEKIKNRCVEVDIPLVMMVAPIPQLSAQTAGVYEEAYELFQGLAEDWNVPYYDFIEHPIPDLKDEAHFFDDHHLNRAGAMIYSERVAEVLKTHLE